MPVHAFVTIGIRLPMRAHPGIPVKPQLCPTSPTLHFPECKEAPQWRLPARGRASRLTDLHTNAHAATRARPSNKHQFLVARAPDQAHEHGLEENGEIPQS